jgi:ribosomal protein S18 acetylase RimI-like enzyme
MPVTDPVAEQPDADNARDFGVAQTLEYDVYAPDDADAMVRLLGEAFSRRDPPALAAGLTASEFEAFARLYCPKAAVEGLTVVARHAGTRDLVGVVLTEDAASGPPDGMAHLSPKFEPIFDILGRLDVAYKGDRIVRPGELLHLFLLGVAESATGRGVAQHLVSTCLQHGARRGYRMAVTEATNRTSQHLFRKLGFTERARQSYGHHRFAGQAVFTSIADHGGPALMDRPLSLT